jgi:hypothetical protein
MSFFRTSPSIVLPSGNQDERNRGLKYLNKLPIKIAITLEIILRIR